MTLIFSNKNRILFTRENADQLLELSYSNRFIPLVDVVTSNLDKRNKILFKNSSNLFDVYKTKKPKSNYYYKSSILASASHKICNKQKRFEFSLQRKKAKAAKEEGHKYRYKPTNLQFAPMCRVGISFFFKPKNQKNKRIDLKSIDTRHIGADRRFVRDYDSSLYKPWSCKQDLSLHKSKICVGASLIDKSLFAAKAATYSDEKEVGTFGLQLKPLSHAEIQKPNLQKKLFLQTSQISNPHANTTLLNSKELCKVFKANHYLFLKGLLKQNLLVKTLKKADGIKVLLPKINLWSFAFGSSFLFLIMTSILQRQEQNSGCSSFFKRQIPGFSTGYQESSWECFENITSKYINRSFDHSIRYAKKTDFTVNPRLSLLSTSVQNKAKNFSIANQSTFVPTCHLECDETAAKKICNLNFSFYKSTYKSFYKSKICTCAGTCKAEIKNINFSNNQLYIDFSEPWNLQSHKNFTAVFPKMIARNAPSKQNKLSLQSTFVQSTFVPNQWIVKPVYQMHAQIPFFHSYPYKPYNLDNTNFNKPKLSFKERLFLENNAIPSKMSCSTNTIFADNYKIRNKLPLFFCSEYSRPRLTECIDKREPKLIDEGKGNLPVRVQTTQHVRAEGQAKNIKAIQCKFVPAIERKNDIVKKFFYEYGFFYIPIKAALIEQNFQDLVLPDQLTYIKQRFLSLLSDLNFGENLASPYKDDLSTNDASQHCDLSSLQGDALPYKGDLLTNDASQHCDLSPLQGDASTYKGDRSTNDASPYKGDASPFYEWNRPINTPIERVSSYLLSKTKTIGPRLMSGYKLAEVKNMLTSRKNRVFIKIPPALPFYKTKFSSFLRGAYESSIDSYIKSYTQNEIHPVKKAQLSTTLQKQKNCTFKKAPLSTDPITKEHSINCLKTMPYRQLSLKEFQEIKPLFEKVNKEMRVSPYKLTFKEPLFIDYNDYLSRPKDSLAAISISPSLEEDKTIHQLWDEHVEKDLLLNQSVENQLAKGSKPVDRNKKEAHTNLDEQPSVADSQIDNLFKNKKESELLSTENKSNSGVELYQENEEKEFNEEEKKKEITKWEWLQNVRESELEVEKRKDFQKLAYPKKEALVTKSLDRVKKYPPFEFQRDASHGLRRKMQRDSCKTLAFKNIQTFLVGDRKYSFFGITNLFPKRLIAEDQRQINNQILREDYDQRKVDFVKFLNKENANRTCQEEEFSSIDDLYAAKAFAPLCGALPWSWKQDLPLNTSPTQKTFEKRQGKNENQEGISILRIAPRNKDFHNFKVVNLNFREAEIGVNKKSYDYSCRINRQHPVYTPNRRLRLRLRDNSKSSQNNTPQSRTDSLNLCQSHRWWQKRRLTSNLLGSPSKRYMVMPEIEKDDWKRIIEWQLKTYFIEEEKRLQPLITSLGTSDIFGGSEKIDMDKQSGNFKIKKIAVYLPWLTIKKSLKKPFEWPLTRLSYQSQELLNSNSRKRDLLLQFPQNGVSSVKNKRLVNRKNRLANLSKNKISINDVSLDSDILQPDFSKLAFCTNQRERRGYIRNNKKPDYCLVSSLSPQFRTLDLSSFKLPLEQNDSRHIRADSGSPEIQSNKTSNQSLSSKDVQRGLHEFVLTNPKFVSKVSAKIKENDSKTKIYKPFIFEAITKDSHLLFHQLLLAIAIKQIFQKIYHLFGKIIVNRIKNSSLGIALLPLFFNVYYRENQISELYRLKKRLKDIVGSEDTISSLSEIVWYLRNSCRGRAVPRGVVLVETHDSESTEFLKAVGGEAKVPVIVQSLRALPLTQNHPQRRLEKILKLAERRAPCILFLDDLDAIGKARTLLLKGNKDSGRTTQSFNQLPDILRNRYNLSISNEKIKWKDLKDSSLTNASSRASFTKHVRGDSYASPISTQKNSPTRLPFFDGSALDTKVRMCQEKIRLSVQEESSFYRLTKQKRNRNMLLFSSNSTRKSDSQKAHAFLLNSFLSSSKFCKQTTPTFSNSAHSNGSFSFFPLIQNGIRFAETICKRKFTSNVTKTNINSEDRDLLSNDKMLEQRRLDLMLRLLTVMDGISHLKGVLIVTTSKNPSSLDPALLRPGRFERFINLKLPNKKRRIELLRIHTSKIGYTNPMPWEYLGAETENMNGTEITNAINHSAFKAIIQSTVHTLSTLEYGIKRVNSEAFTNLPFVAKAGSATRIQRGGNKNLECPESPSFKLIDKLADQPCKISFVPSARECSLKFKKSKLSSYNLAISCQGTKKNTLLVGAGLVNKTNINNASGDPSPCKGDASLMMSKNLRAEQRKVRLINTPYNCSIDKCQNQSKKIENFNSKNKEKNKVLRNNVSDSLLNFSFTTTSTSTSTNQRFVKRFVNRFVQAEICDQHFQHKNFTFVRSLHVRAESQLSFYQAGKGVVQALLFSHSAHSEFPLVDLKSTSENSIRRYKEKNIQFNSSFVPQYFSLMKRGIHPKGRFAFYKKQSKKALLCKKGSKIRTGNLILVDFAEDFINLYAGRASESLYLDSIIRKICKTEESLTNTIIRKICKAEKKFTSTSTNLTLAI